MFSPQFNSRARTISRAAENVRNQNGYRTTGATTRSFDDIYEDTNGKRFTVQNVYRRTGRYEYRKIPYRGTKGMQNAVKFTQGGKG